MSSGPWPAASARPVSSGPSTKGASGDTGAQRGGAAIVGGASVASTASGDGGGGDFLQAAATSASATGSTRRIAPFVQSLADRRKYRKIEAPLWQKRPKPERRCARISS